MFFTYIFWVALYDPPHTAMKQRIVLTIQDRSAEKLLCDRITLKEKTEHEIRRIQERRNKR